LELKLKYSRLSWVEHWTWVPCLEGYSIPHHLPPATCHVGLGHQIPVDLLPTHRVNISGCRSTHLCAHWILATDGGCTSMLLLFLLLLLLLLMLQQATAMLNLKFVSLAVIYTQILQPILIMNLIFFLLHCVCISFAFVFIWFRFCYWLFSCCCCFKIFLKKERNVEPAKLAKKKRKNTKKNIANIILMRFAQFTGCMFTRGGVVVEVREKRATPRDMLLLHKLAGNRVKATTETS